MDEVQLERRFLQLESKMDTANAVAVVTAAANAASAETRQSVILEKLTGVNTVIKALDTTVSVQNGRIGKLEGWRTQVQTLYGAFIVAAPFVFYGLTRLFGG